MTALEYAQAAHGSINHTRPILDGSEPYFNHVERVANLVAGPALGTYEMVSAAFLHDVLEDVYPKNKAYSPESIQRHFGDEVFRIVLELTDVYTKEAYTFLNRAERKKNEALRLSVVSDAAKIVKMADIVDNHKSIEAKGGKFAEVWRKEKEVLIPKLLPVSERWFSSYNMLKSML